MQGHFATSEDYARRAIAISRDLGELEATAVRRWCSPTASCSPAGSRRRATTRSRRSRIARDVGNVALEADALTRLVHVSVIVDDLDQAIDYGLLGVEVGEQASSDLDRGYAHLSVGYALRWKGRYDEADDHFDRAHALFDGPLPRHADPRVHRRAGVGGRLPGSRSEAVGLLEPVLDHLSPAEMVGACLPATMLRGCVEVLRLADDPRRDDGRSKPPAATSTRRPHEIGDPDLRGRLPRHPPERRRSSRATAPSPSRLRPRACTCGWGDSGAPLRSLEPHVHVASARASLSAGPAGAPQQVAKSTGPSYREERT